MAKRPDRVIVDTNLWIAFLITGDFKKFDEKIKLGRVKVLFSLESIEELLTVAERPKFRKYFDRQDLTELIDLFDAYGEVVDVESKVEICRDAKDNFLLALAKDFKSNLFNYG